MFTGYVANFLDLMEDVQFNNENLNSSDLLNT